MYHNRKSFFFVFISAATALLSSCMAIKNTDGIKECLLKQGRADFLAFELKKKFPDKNSEEYKKAQRLFNVASGATRGYLQGIIIDAEGKYEIDVPKTDFEARDVDTFLVEGQKLMDQSVMAFDPVSALAIAGFVVAVIDKVWQWNNKLRGEAVKRVTTAIKEAYPVPFSDLDSNYFRKYPKPDNPAPPNLLNPWQ